MKKISLAILTLAVLFCVAGCSKKSDGSIKIGGVFPLTGAVSVYGVECKNGIDLAIEEINAAGGVNGKQIVLISEDDEGNPDKSVNAFQKLTTKDGVKMVIGSLTSGCTKAMTQRAQAMNVLQIAPAATATDITDAGNYIFRACFIDPFQGTVGGKFSIETLRAKKAAILYDSGNDYSVGLTENFEKTFKDLGGTIVAKESYATNDKDFNAQLTKIKSASPEVLYLPDYYGTVALIAKQARSQGIMIPLVGADGWDGLVANAGDEVLNGYYSNHYAADSDSPAVHKFVNSFRSKYRKDPNSFAALGYDSVYLIRDSILKAGTDEVSAVRDALEKIDGDYVTGRLRFDEKRNPIKAAVMLQLILDADENLNVVYKTTVNP